MSNTLLVYRLEIPFEIARVACDPNPYSRSYFVVGNDGGVRKFHQVDDSRYRQFPFGEENTDTIRFFHVGEHDRYVAVSETRFAIVDINTRNIEISKVAIAAFSGHGNAFAYLQTEEPRAVHIHSLSNEDAACLDLPRPAASIALGTNRIAALFADNSIHVFDRDNRSFLHNLTLNAFTGQMNFHANDLWILTADERAHHYQEYGYCKRTYKNVSALSTNNDAGICLSDPDGLLVIQGDKATRANFISPEDVQPKDVQLTHNNLIIVYLDSNKQPWMLEKPQVSCSLM